MASGSKDDQDAVSKHILDYYQRYSQNRHLPKYFSGTSVSYLPEIKGDSDSEPELCTYPQIIVTYPDKRDNSRASSAMSNKKLEWDNGADIGYENCQRVSLKRSSSLPALLESQHNSHVNLEADKCYSSSSELKIVILSTSSESNSESNKTKPGTSTSSSLNEDDKKLLSSSSSEQQEKKYMLTSSSKSTKMSTKGSGSSAREITEFAGTLSYLKQKIGLPDAHSTPHQVIEQRQLAEDYPETPFLPITQKPVRRITEQTGDTKQVTLSNQKIITLCMTKPVNIECCAMQNTNVGIQTDRIEEQYASTSKTKRNERTAKSESSTQPESASFGSNCDSFEYMQNIEDKKLKTRSQIGTENSKVVELAPKSQSSNEIVEESRTASSSDSDNLKKIGDDVEKSVYLLQKLIKSKRYDDATKRYYIRKLIKKLSKSRIMEESSTSSELFLPRKSNVHKEPAPETSSTGSSSEPHQNRSLHPTDFSWRPAKKPPNFSPRKKPLEAQVYFHEVLTTPTEIIPIDARDTRKNLFTLTNNEFSVNRDLGSCKSRSDDASLEKQYESSFSLKRYQNWKDDKTASEKAFEEVGSNGNGDCLTNCAQERQHQINWISNEMQQLGKLKNMLEQLPRRSPSVTGSRSSESQKTTSVYKLSQENLTPSEKKSKKYVIETQIDPKVGEPGEYLIGGNRFTIEQKIRHTGSKTRQVLGDIDVVSSDNTMNIRVTAFCGICKRSPCVCLRDRNGKHPSKENHEKGHQKDSSICICCHTRPCICKKSTGAISKKCCICGSYPCTCLACNSDSLFGTFIPTDRSRLATVPLRRKCSCCSSEVCACRETKGQYNSLKRVFENCTCTSTKCNCDFVEKLVRHFDKDAKQLSKSVQTLQTQTEKDTQICTDVVTQSSQTSKKQVDEANQINREELGDRDESTYINVPLSENAVQTEKLAKKWSTKTQTNSSTFRVKHVSVNTCPKITNNRGTQSDAKKYKSEGICTETDTPKTYHASVQSDTLIPPVLGRCDVIYCEQPTPSIAVVKEVQDEAVNTTPRPETCHKCTQFEAKDILTRVVANIRDGGARIVTLDGEVQSEEAGKVLTETVQTVNEYEKTVPTQTCRIQEPSVHATQTSGGTHETEKQTENLKGASIREVQTDDAVEMSTQATEKVTKLATQVLQTEPGDASQILRTIKYDEALKVTASKEVQTSFRFSKEILLHEKGAQTTEMIQMRTQENQADEKVVRIQTEEEKEMLPRGVQAGLYKKNQDTHMKIQSSDAQTNTYPRSRSRERRIRFLGGSDTELENLQKSQTETCTCGCHRRKFSKDMICICNCRSKKIAIFTEQTRVLKCKRIGTDEEQGRRKNKGVTTDKGRSTVGTCRCGFTNRVCMKDEDVQVKMDSSEHQHCSYSVGSSNDTTETTTSKETPPSDSLPSSLFTCICCDRPTSSENASVFTNNSSQYYLCSHCIKKRPILTSVCYTGPEKRPTISTPEVSDTLTRTESTGEFCTCTTPFKTKHSDYCSHCRNRLRKTVRCRNGIAYTLTLECESPEKFKFKKKRKKPLEEIRVKVPCPYSRKKSKDMENMHRKGSFDIPKTGRDSNGKSSETNCTVEFIGSTETKATSEDYGIDSTTGDSKGTSKRPLSLQDHLRQNRPDFIDSADFRRAVVNTAKVDRIQRKDEIKLRFFEANIRVDPNGRPRLFTEKQMKEITKRNYKKLPEVKLKVVRHKEEKLKVADRFIKNTLARKIQSSVLKGKRNFPLDKHVVNLKK